MRECEEEKDSKKLWAYINKRMTSKESGPPTRLEARGKILRKPYEIAEEQNSYYIKKVRDIREDLLNKKKEEDDPLSILRMSLNTWDKKLDPMSELYFSPISLDRTKSLIREIKNSTTEGLDTISNMVIREGIDQLAGPLQHIINLSLTTNQFPNHWRLTKIIPLYKGKGERSITQNYRPVALLSGLSKILECEVFKQLAEHMFTNCLINPNHHAYIPNKT